MSDLISTIQADEGNVDPSDQEEHKEESEELESTSLENIEDFNKWAKAQASKDLSKFKNLSNICDINEFRLKISSLNNQQRRLFDDFAERCASSDVDENPVYLFLAGNAGTGKSFLVQLLIEAVKIIKIED